MKNKFLLSIFFLIFIKSTLYAESLLIEAKNISIDKKTQTSIFEKDVLVVVDEAHSFSWKFLSTLRQEFPMLLFLSGQPTTQLGYTLRRMGGCADNMFVLKKRCFFCCFIVP